MEKTVYIVFIFLFLLHNWLPDFQLESATLLPGIQVESATFFSGILESRNPGILAELVESLPLFCLES